MTRTRRHAKSNGSSIISCSSSSQGQGKSGWPWHTASSSGRSQVGKTVSLLEAAAPGAAEAGRLPSQLPIGPPCPKQLCQFGKKLEAFHQTLIHHPAAAKMGQRNCSPKACAQNVPADMSYDAWQPSTTKPNIGIKRATDTHKNRTLETPTQWRQKGPQPGWPTCLRKSTQNEHLPLKHG